MLLVMAKNKLAEIIMSKYGITLVKYVHGDALDLVPDYMIELCD